MKQPNESDTILLERIYRELEGGESDLSQHPSKSVKYYLRRIHAQLGHLLQHTEEQVEEEQSRMRWAMTVVGLVALILLANGAQSDPEFSWIQRNWLALKIWGALLAIIYMSASLEQSQLWRALWTLTSTRWITYVTFTAMVLVASGKAAAHVNSVFAIDATLVPITYAFTTALVLFKLALPWLFALATCLLIINFINLIYGIKAYTKDHLLHDLPWQPLLFTILGCFVVYQVLSWTDNELSNDQLAQKIYLMAQALDFNGRHDCINVSSAHPVIFLGPTQQHVLVAPEAFEPFDFTTFFTAQVGVPDRFERLECQFAASPRR